MSSFDRVSELLEEALRLPVSRRAEFLDEACGGDADLKREVEELLDADERAGGFLATGAPGSLEARLFETLQGTRIGEFELRSVLAVGGMGTVYRARGEHPSRDVALKVMRLGLADPAARRRFEDEAEILGRLSHPGIAQVYAAGVHVDPERFGALEVPWFALELVEGARDLLRHAREEGLGLEPRVELAAAVCDAVQHGHQHGVVHRDLKPANVLVGQDGSPKVIDFGIARVLRQGDAATIAATRQGELLGTLRYMSPEQLSGSPELVDTRSDVYSLGVVLYELLCGRPPFQLETTALTDVARVVCETPPAPPHSVAPSVPEELGWVLLRALEKEPSRRYASASELAADLRRFLDHEPLLAGPPSRIYRLRKLARRHRTLVGSVAAALLALVVGTALAVAGLFEARRERDVAAAEAEKARLVASFFSQMLTSAHPELDGPDARVVDVVGRAAGRIEEEFAGRPELQVVFDRAVGEVHFGLGDYRTALEHLERARERSAAVHGPEAAETLYLDNRIGSAWLDLGEVSRAEEQYRRVLGAARSAELAGPELYARAGLSAVRLLQGRFEESQTLLDEVLAREDADAAFDRRELWGLRARLGQIELQAGRYAEAAAHFEPAAEWYEREDPAAPSRFTVMGNLALCYARLGRGEEAATLQEEAYEQRVARYGRDHPDTVASMHNWAGELMARGRYEEADALFEEALAWRRESLGAEHPRTLKTLNQLAVLRVRQERSEEAAALLGEAVDAARLTMRDDPQLASLLANRGALLARLGRREEAEDLLVEALDALDRIGEPGAYLVEPIRARLGALRAESAPESR